MKTTNSPVPALSISGIVYLFHLLNSQHLSKTVSTIHFSLLPLLGTLLLLLVPTSTALDTLTYDSYIKSATFSVATDRGFFATQNLSINYMQIPNSSYGYAQLLNGAYDVVNAAADNVINRRFNQGLPFQMLGQQDTGVQLWLMGVPSITSVQQLRGEPILVDAPDSGYVYVLAGLAGTAWPAARRL